MARVLNDALPPLGIATPEVPAGDDEIAVHAEAIDDGRDAPETALPFPVELQDDEIASHLEEGEMVFAPLPSRHVRRRRALRH
jgi:hypothetical protein